MKIAHRVLHYGNLTLFAVDVAAPRGYAAQKTKAGLGKSGVRSQNDHATETPVSFRYFAYRHLWFSIKNLL